MDYDEATAGFARLEAWYYLPDGDHIWGAHHIQHGSLYMYPELFWNMLASLSRTIVFSMEAHYQAWDKHEGFGPFDLSRIEWTVRP